MKAKAKAFLLLFFALAPVLSGGAEGKELSASSDPADLKSFVDRINRTERPSIEQLNSLALAYDWLRDYDSAIRTYGRVIERRPDDSEAYFQRGVMYKQAHRLAPALKDLNKAESLGFKGPGLNFERMLVRLALEDFKAAAQDASKYLKHDPSNALSYYVIGRSESERNREIQALKFFDKAIELDPAKPEFVYMRGLSYERLGRKKEAEVDFLKAKELGWQ